MYAKVIVDKIGSGGLNTDMPQWALPPSFITDGRNFRVKDNKIISTYGQTAVTSNTYGATAGTISPSGAANEGSYPDFLIGHTNGIVKFKSSGAASLMTAATNTDAKSWTWARLGPMIIANHPTAGCWYWYPGKTTDSSGFGRLPFKTGTNWATNNKFGKIIRSHKNFLFMLNLTESSVPMPDSYRWSHPADANAIPVTWDETDAAFIAGLAALGAKSRNIIDGKSLKENFIIYSEDSINNLYLSGDGFIWNRSEVTSATGLHRSECIAELNGIHYLLCKDDFAICDGSAITSIANGVILRHFLANVDATAYRDYAFVAVNNQEREVWFCVPVAGDTNGCSLAYIYDTDDGSWTVRDIKPSGGGVIRHATWGYQPAGNNIFERSVIGVDINAKAYNLDPLPPVAVYNHADNSSITPSTVDCWIERQNLNISGLDQESMIVSARPMLKGKGDVQFYIGSHAYAGANVVWKDPITFNIRSSDRIPLRCSGKLHAWKISGVNGAIFELSGIEFEIAASGKR